MSAAETDLVARLEQKIDYIAKAVDKIEIRLDKNYVTMDRYQPVERLVYGVLGLLVFSFVGGLIALIWKVGK